MKTEQLVCPIGIYEDRYEFQVKTTIIWVFTKELGPHESLRRANERFQHFWGLIPSIMSSTEQISRELHRDLWLQHDSNGTKDSPLKVWGIWFYPDSDESHYEINLNHDYPSGNNHPEFPEESIIIDAKGKMISSE